MHCPSRQDRVKEICTGQEQYKYTTGLIKMLTGLEQLEREMELRKPENRRIIRAYSTAENARLDEAVYSPIGKKYPSMTGVLEKLRKEGDPIGEMEAAKSQFRTLGIVKGLAGLLDLADADEDTRAVKTMLDKFDPLVELYGKFAPIQEQFYVNLAHAVKDISTRNAVSIDETVRNLQYLDAVSRIVIPTREEAESFLRTSQSVGREMLDIVRGCIAFAKKTGRANKEVLEPARLLPTTAATEVMQRAIWDYRMQEFSRVYSR